MQRIIKPGGVLLSLSSCNNPPGTPDKKNKTGHETHKEETPGKWAKVRKSGNFLLLRSGLKKKKLFPESRATPTPSARNKFL